MSIVYKDLVKETSTTTGPDAFTLGGAATGYVSFASQHTAGDKVAYTARHATLPEFEVGVGTFGSDGKLTRDTVYTSSNNNQIVSFSAGSKDVFEEISGTLLSKMAAPDAALTSAVANASTSTLLMEEGGVFKRIKIADLLTAIGSSSAQLSAAGTLHGTDIMVVTQDNINETRTTLDGIASYVATKIGAPADTTPPTFVSAQVANASPTVIQITMSKTLGATLPPTSAFTVSGGKTVTSVAIAGANVNLTCSAAYANGDAITVTYTKPGSGNMLIDTATVPNAAATFGPSSVTNNVAAAGSTVTGVSISPTTATVSGAATQQFTATVTGTGSPSQTGTWSSTIGSISTSGLFTAPAATGSAQTVTITFTSAQNSAFAATATVTVPAAAATAPGAPTIGTVTAGDASASVAFTAPSSNGGATITGYTVTAYKASDNTVVTTATGTTSPINVTGLTNGVGVYFRVAATNSVGTGAQSTASSTVTPNATVAYTIAGYSGNTINTTPVDRTSGSVINGAKYIGPGPDQSSGYYWDINATSGGAQPASAMSGWSNSSTVPPGVVPDANYNTDHSINYTNGLVPMGKSAAFYAGSYLWVPVGSGTTTWYMWVKPVDGIAKCVNPKDGSNNFIPLTVTGA
jgi:hypothetical protein